LRRSQGGGLPPKVNEGEAKDRDPRPERKGTERKQQFIIIQREVKGGFLSWDSDEGKGAGAKEKNQERSP